MIILRLTRGPHHYDVWHEEVHERWLPVLQEGFEKLDKKFRHEQGLPGRDGPAGNSSATEKWPGCTALAALLIGSQLWVANAGQPPLHIPCETMHLRTIHFCQETAVG